MAKISARGATEVAALTSDRDADGYGLRIVLASDGRILRRLTHRNGGTGFNVVARCKPLPAGADTEAVLLRWAQRRYPARTWSVA